MKGYHWSKYIYIFFARWESDFKGSRKIYLELEVITSLPITVSLAWLLKLRPCCWKCLQADIAFGFFSIFSMIFQSNVIRSLCFSYVFFITLCAFYQVNNVLTFAVDFTLDFKFSLFLLTDKFLVDVNWLQHWLAIFDKHVDHLPMVNVFYNSLPLCFRCDCFQLVLLDFYFF